MAVTHDGRISGYKARDMSILNILGTQLGAAQWFEFKTSQSIDGGTSFRANGSLNPMSTVRGAGQSHRILRLMR